MARPSPAVNSVCASCGGENREGQKFCGECGAALVTDPAPGKAGPLIPSGLEGERKQLTVLFADVQGSMDLQEDLDPEQWAGIMDRLVKILADGVRRFGGTVDKFTGDGIMALFGAPFAQEDHARRACHAAWHLASAIADSGPGLSPPGVNLHVRLGLNSGEVVVGRVGGDACFDPTALGHTVGLAQRMEALAQPGRVYLTEHTARLVEGWFRLADQGLMVVKGAREPLRVFVLEGPVLLPPAVRGSGAFPLVGRDRELAVLEEALAASSERRAQVVGVMGEAGVGKSRLCEEFARSAAARGVTTRRTTGVSHGRDIPLLPILALLRDYFSIAEADGPEQTREKVTRHLVHLDPALEGALPLVFDFLEVPDPDRPAPQLAPEVRLRRIFETLGRVAHLRSDREVLVVVAEDLHWFDPQSEAFLERLIESIPGSRTLVLVNFRPEFSASWMRHPCYRHLPLAPLPDEAVGELMEAFLGVDRSVTALVGFVLERTGGNPFFIEEVVRALVEDGTLIGDRGEYRLTRPLDQLKVPPSVHAVLAARIDRLAAEHKRVLQTASVIGRTLPKPVLAKVADLDDAVLEGALRALCDAQLLHGGGSSPAVEYRFWHPLTQEVAYGTLLGERRAGVHGAVARAIVELEPGRLGERAALVATHFEHAGDHLEAARWNARAATWALRSDLNEAVRRWRAVLAHLSRSPETEETLRLGIGVRWSLVSWGIRTGMTPEEGDALLAEASERADRVDDPVQHGLLRAIMGSKRVARGDLGEGAAIMVEAARRGDRLGDPGLMGGVWVCAWTQGLAEALSLTDRAIEHCHGRADVGMERVGYSALARGLLNRAQLLARTGKLDEARTHADQALALGRDRSESEVLVMTLSLYPRLALFTGDDDGTALARANEAVAIAEDSGNVIMGLMALASVAVAELVRGRWAAVADVVERGLAEGRRRSLRFVDADLLTHLALSELARLKPEAALATADEAVAVASAQGARVFECAARLARGRALSASGSGDRRDRAEGELRAALTLADELGATTYEPFIREELGRLQCHEPALREALRLFMEIGAEGHARRLHADLNEPPWPASPSGQG